MFFAGEAVFLPMKTRFSMATEIGRAILLVDDRVMSQQRVFKELQLVAGDESCMRIFYLLLH